MQGLYKSLVIIYLYLQFNQRKYNYNKYIRIIRLLHVSTPNVSSSGRLLCYRAKLHEYNCSSCKNCKLLEDDTFGVETCSSLIISYIFIIIVLSLVELQIIKNGRYMYWNAGNQFGLKEEEPIYIGLHVSLRADRIKCRNLSMVIKLLKV